MRDARMCRCAFVGRAFAAARPGAGDEVGAQASRTRSRRGAQRHTRRIEFDAATAACRRTNNRVDRSGYVMCATYRRCGRFDARALPARRGARAPIDATSRKRDGNRTTWNGDASRAGANAK
ncbi:hypothetical protein WT60_25250 [Burkholderia sp. MSMB617WGS]|nr:hypothetical protein WS78_23130 [Burkholderia savannae]AOK50147.1 hypothetical protein WT60_25250 [Burkholderia sp. MSMB617WGS]KVG47714.1 hypothetical protein WS77_27710 [Burkholderia sp. MSMB0265]KVG80601.1 hypothetical protein WS81_13055 [Burkholderia sp. MSMB2040]KVG94022.1 hypothetical protein WS83_07955 [Burkholderia sp. MSMB2042]KVG96665.1 hypothetical protein WS82_31640 [Burkholderia sp. MSMB2041]KVK88031.1 hypothetical protein WS91_30550 [Burkholderia sp. MSMB1498]